MSQQLSYVAITIAFDFCEIFMATEAWYTLVSTMTAQKVGQQNIVSLPYACIALEITFNHVNLGMNM